MIFKSVQFLILKSFIHYLTDATCYFQEVIETVRKLGKLK